MDIEVDGEGFVHRDGCMQPPQTDLSKRHHSVEDQVDSGLGSLGYFSGELNSGSLCLSVTEEEPAIQKDAEVTTQNLGSLESSLSNLNISNKLSERCDSGLDEKQFDSTDSVSGSEQFHWLSPHFSPDQVMDIFRGDEDGDNHLHLSIIHGLPNVTMQIIGLAPNWDWLNQTNNLLQTPLHIAVITRQIAVVRRLLCAGASADVRDQLGNTPLHNACRLGFDDVVRTLLVPVELKETYQNKYEIPAQRLPQDLESRNYEGLTCLHLAAIGGHIDIMKMLLKAGANVNTIEGKSGRTVLHFAADWGNMEMMKFLLSRRDTNMNAITYSGLSPVLLAYGRRHAEMVEEFYRRGAACEALSLSDDSDADISDEEMSDEVVVNRQLNALPLRAHQNSYR